MAWTTALKNLAATFGPILFVQISHYHNYHLPMATRQPHFPHHPRRSTKLKYTSTFNTILNKILSNVPCNSISRCCIISPQPPFLKCILTKTFLSCHIRIVISVTQRIHYKKQTQLIQFPVSLCEASLTSYYTRFEPPPFSHTRMSIPQP
jgi:hypothetical protein